MQSSPIPAIVPVTAAFPDSPPKEAASPINICTDRELMKESDVPVDAIAAPAKKFAQTAVAAAVARPGQPVAMDGPELRCNYPPLRVRLPPNARIGNAPAAKQQRVAPEVNRDEAEPAAVAVAVTVATAEPEATAATAAAAGRPRYLSVAAAATETGLPKAVVKSWAAQGFMDTLKPGSDNSHRLVEMGDLMRFVELKREIARTDLRKKLEEEQAERQLAADAQDCEEEKERGDITLVYLRVPEEEDPADRKQRSLDGDPEDLTPQQVHALNVGLQQLGDATGFNNRKTCPTVGEVGSAEDLDRTGFDEVVTHILGRKINRIVLAYPGQICNAGAWPLFKWLCDSFDVAIVCLHQTESAQ